MKSYEIKEIISKSFIESLLKDESFNLEDIAKKNKINIKILNTLFPFNDKFNKYELVKIFLETISENVLIQFYNEINEEEISFYEKVLEGLFMKFEVLDKYKKALIDLSSSLDKKINNFLILNYQNHIFMMKLLKISGDNDDNLRLNIKALVLNSIYLKNLNLFLSSQTVSLEKIMNNLDKDLNNIFKNGFLFKNN